MNQKIKTSLAIYLLFIAIFSYNIYSGNFSWYSEFFILWLLLMIIKDFLIHAYTIKNTEYNVINYKKVFNDITGPLSFTWVFLIINRNILFPLLLIIYLCVLVLEQTHIFTIKLPVMLSWTWLIFATIFSWICSIFNETIDNIYLSRYDSLIVSQLHILLSIVLSLLWVYIIMGQTTSLWTISYIISLLSWCIIFLVWISLLEDDGIWENVKHNTH